MAMDNDDTPVGRLLSRRQAMTLLGSAGAAWAAGFGPPAAAQSPLCVARPEQTEGPYFVERRLQRADIRADSASGSLRAGMPLTLTFNVARLGTGGCRPLAGAIVDVWHCDAAGTYSGVEGGSDFLRGYQLSDDDGAARFVTIYPGRYSGRTVHIHFKVRTAGQRGHEFTSQLYFDEALNDRVHAGGAYASRPRRFSRNEDDFIYRRGGEQLTLRPDSVANGYAAAFNIALDLS
jgi:protocatechuate 3,4-dioxygenase beta subunit